MTWIELAHLRRNLLKKTGTEEKLNASLKVAEEKSQEKEGALADYSSAHSQLLAVSIAG